ncbi:hypothetical protein K4A83_04280 [Spirulina subsalsa FACHB-351]|uniref:Lipoprotein n=1 Tax=Spirulina subsalsa FACHB-351 TaxID=234711 RepID=A0ABT3L1Y1_9CYAN|nr:hypothetical protein [Spirulina subsalsa]MCW6035494.1 hypothetical protein [Spirulina subsalsa FACHB-351]
MMTSIHSLALLLFLLVLPLLGCETPSGDITLPLPDDVAEPQPSLAMVEEVMVEVEQGDSQQVTLKVTGILPDGCDLPLQVEQEREGSQITVQLYRLLPPDVMCPAVVVPFEKDIPLNEGLESGSYRLMVNEKTLDFEL